MLLDYDDNDEQSWGWVRRKKQTLWQEFEWLFITLKLETNPFLATNLFQLSQNPV